MTVDIMMQSSTLFPELDTSNVGRNSCEDERALQIALELSNLGLLGNCDDDPSSYDDITKGKKSQNMTECVPVPSSEHVAEIVGRQGCKIKALRAKTNTYIKTPVRGEEPVFVVTGRKEDVAMARREVQSAAEHFTQIRATRNRHALLASQAFGTGNGEGTSGAITLQVRVPYRVVGLVVGPKGATIKRIQQQTHTYIVTPSRDKEPVFEVTGLPENVEKAKEEIEAHIALRTGSQQTSIDDDFRNNGTDVGSPCLGSGFKPSITARSTASFLSSTNLRSSVLRSAAPNFFPMSTQHGFKQVNPASHSAMTASSIDNLGFGDNPYQPNISGGLPQNENQTATWSMGVNNNRFDSSLPSLLSSINTDPVTTISINPSNFNQHSRLSPTLSDPEFPVFTPLLLSNNTSAASHLPVRRVGSEESSTSSAPSLDMSSLLSPVSSYAPTAAVNIESGYSSSGTADSMSGSPDSALGTSRDIFPTKPQRCFLCSNAVSAALVPCGHHLFCYTCANDIVSKSAVCPCCCQTAAKALLIKQ